MSDAQKAMSELGAELHQVDILIRRAEKHETVCEGWLKSAKDNTAALYAKRGTIYAKLAEVNQQAAPAPVAVVEAPAQTEPAQS